MRPVLFLIFLITVIGFTACNKEKEDVNAGLPISFQFTHLPTDISEMLEFGPVGTIAAIPKAHGGFMLKTFRQEANIPVYAMCDGIITNIIKDTRIALQGFAPEPMVGYEYDDYALDIALSRTASMWYGHVSRLSDEILTAAPNLNSGYGVPNKVKIEIKEGQIIGFIGPHPGFDIGLYDFAKELSFANPSRYGEQYRHMQPWTDYLISELLDQVWAINPRTHEPKGGKINHDVIGTAAGNWFLQGTTELTQWSKQLIIARHEIYADKITIADASPLVDGPGYLNEGKEPYIWFVKGNSPNPEDITVASGLTKYEVIKWWRSVYNPDPSVDGSVALQLINESTLKYEYFEEKTSDQINGFSENAKIYER